MSSRRWALVAAGAVVAIVGSYTVGHRAGARAQRVATDEQLRKALAESLTVQQKRTARDSAAVAAVHVQALRAHDTTIAAVHHDARMRDERAQLRAVVAIPTPTPTVPPSHVDSLEQLVRVDDATIAADSVAIAAAQREAAKWHSEADSLRALFVDVRHEATLSEQQTHVTEDELGIAPGRHCDWKCGAVLGATAAYAASRPHQVAAAVRWVVRLVAR